jgi:hypothetical protein
MVYRKTTSETAYGILKIKVNEKEKKGKNEFISKEKGEMFFLLRGRRRQPFLLYKIQRKP